MKLIRDFSLKKLNTFGIEARAKFYLKLSYENQLNELADVISKNNLKSLCIGAGSNLLFVNDFDGILISNELKGIRILDSDDEIVTLQVSAGENWHNFVSIALKNKLYGLENLALIPGKVGAAPIQNIGAYGVEQSEFFVSLRAFDIASSKIKTFRKEDCHFDYRTSIFKTLFKRKFIVLDVIYKLSRKPVLNLKYKELEEEVKKIPTIHPDPEYIFESVCRIRKRKLPDPSVLGNAGSFFKNPIIDNEKYIGITKKYEDFRGFELADGRFKVFAAWLIEKCGWKGFRDGDTGVHHNHSLILVNYGNATGADIKKLAENIRESVLEKFDILLEPEVEIID